MDKKAPELRVIPGGDLATKVGWDILAEIAKPEPLNERRIAELKARRAPKGKLRLVKH